MSVENKYNSKCPYFKVGTCKGYICNECKYTWHVKCDDNFKCSDLNCDKGHGISKVKREIVCKIYEVNYHENGYGIDTAREYCSYGMTCYKTDCENIHDIELKYRQFIANIAKNNTDNESLRMFSTKFNLTPDIFKSNIVTDFVEPDFVEPEIVQSEIIQSEIVQSDEVNNTNDSVELKIEEEKALKISNLMENQKIHSKYLLNICSIQQDIENMSNELIRLENESCGIKNQVSILVTDMASDLNI